MLRNIYATIGEHLNGGSAAGAASTFKTSVPLLPGASDLEIEKGDLLAAQTAAAGSGRELYYQLVKRYHSFESIMSGVSVPKNIENKCMGKQI